MDKKGTILNAVGLGSTRALAALPATPSRQMNRLACLVDGDATRREIGALYDPTRFGMGQSAECWWGVPQQSLRAGTDIYRSGRGS